MSKNEQICPTCGNGHTYHNCADPFHAPWKNAEPPAGAAGTKIQFESASSGDGTEETPCPRCGATGPCCCKFPPQQTQGGTPEEATRHHVHVYGWGVGEHRIVLSSDVEVIERQRNEARAALAATQAEVEELRTERDNAVAILKGAEYERLDQLKEGSPREWRKIGELVRNITIAFKDARDEARAELEQTRRELAEMKNNRDFVIAQRDTERSEVKRLSVALTAAEQRADGAEKERDEARIAWMAKVDELAAQRDTATRERDEAIARERQWLSELEVRRGHVAEAEKHLRETREERDAAAKDTARLDWLITHSAYLSHSRDGEVCNVWFSDDPNEDSGGPVPAEGYPQKCYHDARAAIDAALAAKTTEGGV